VLLAGSSWLLISSVVFPIGTLFAERLFHMPACALLLAAVAALDRVVASARAPAFRRGAVAAGALALLVLGTRTFVRTDDWHDELTLYTRALDVVPDCARVHCSVGQLLRLADREQEAWPPIARALEILPTYRQALSEQGMLELDRARTRFDAPALGRAYVWFWLADHASGSTRIEHDNFQQVIGAVRQTGLKRDHITVAARTIGDSRHGIALYEQMRKALAPGN
jgi:hypothetical protein